MPYSSSDDTSSLASHSSEEIDILPLSYLANYEYKSKCDILQAVTAYHRSIMRGFKIVRSSKSRYSFTCKESNCEFRCRFFFKNGEFRQPAHLVPHSCSSTASAKTNSKSIASEAQVIEWMSKEGRNATISSLIRFCSCIGLNPKYYQAFHAFKKLQEHFFESDIRQYGYLKSYAECLVDASHNVQLEVDEETGQFKRLMVLYWQGRQAFEVFHDRGLQLDGTFLKASTGGTLLLACFKDANNCIQILAIAIVSGENTDNWKCFLEFVKSNITKRPAFIISDREKGLAAAVCDVFDDVSHYFCFRHVMENFNARFKDKNLKKIAWRLARSLNDTEFDAAKQNLCSDKRGQEPWVWLNQIGLSKICLGKSEVSRFGISTSNNVESINSKLRKARNLPILELLIAIETAVTIDRAKRLEDAQRWQSALTLYCQKKIEYNMKQSEAYSLQKYSDNLFCVSKGTGIWNVKIEGNLHTCPCGFYAQYKYPCIHMCKVLLQEEKLY